MAKIRYKSNGARDFHGLEEEFDNAMMALASEEWKHPNNKQIVIEYLGGCAKGKIKSGGKNKRVGKSTLYRLLGIFKMLSEEWLDKDFDSVSDAEWDMFYDRMEEDDVVQQNGKPYNPNTKAKTYKTIKKFCKWRYGNDMQYPAYCAGWVTTERIPTRDILQRNEVERLMEAASALRVKCMLMMLFDGGFRVGELGCLRWHDVRIPEGKEYYKAHVRAETTKTKKERYVSLWLTRDLLDSYRNHVKNKKGRDFREEDIMFPLEYRSIYETVKRLGETVLGKDVSPHLLRHSSASYYAGVIKTYQQFCSRYGWDLKSGVAQRYFHKVDDDEIAEQSKEHEIARFKTQMERISLENTQLHREMDKIREAMTTMQVRIMSMTQEIKVVNEG